MKFVAIIDSSFAPVPIGVSKNEEDVSPWLSVRPLLSCLTVTGSYCWISYRFRLYIDLADLRYVAPNAFLPTPSVGIPAFVFVTILNETFGYTSVEYRNRVYT